MESEILIDELRLHIKVKSYRPGRAARLSYRPEDCEPAEGAEADCELKFIDTDNRNKDFLIDIPEDIQDLIVRRYEYEIMAEIHDLYA